MSVSIARNHVDACSATTRLEGMESHSRRRPAIPVVVSLIHKCEVSMEWTTGYTKLCATVSSEQLRFAERRRSLSPASELQDALIFVEHRLP